MEPKILKRLIPMVLLLAAMLIATFASAQVVDTRTDYEIVLPHNPEEPCVPPGFYEMLNAEIESNMARLASEGRLITNNRVMPPPQKFDWPLTNETHFLGNDYFFIQNYIDHDTVTGSISDFMCGTRSYDLQNGYDHRGTDICIGPYWWNMMDDMKVRVIAAAPGQIVSRNDGNFDRSCGLGGNPTPQPNSITIVHEDGTRAVYLHMKNGSLTSKQVGESVIAGEYLGYVGSSGQSTNPHLHFEVQDSNGVFKDPWAGPCNPDFIQSRWNNQKPYPNSGIMSILTMSGVPSAPACPGPETVPYSNHFEQGANVRVEVHLRDMVDGSSCLTRIYNPAGSMVYTNTTNINGFAAGNWFNRNYILPNNAAVGTYRVLVTYQGKTAAHYFTVGCPGSYNLSGAITGYKGYITGGNITTTQTITGSSGNNIWYEAVDYIQVNPGFTATAGCKFRARIDACAENILRSVDSEIENELKLQANPSIVTEKTQLRLNVPSEGPVSIVVLDLAGRLVTTLVDNQSIMQGVHEFELSTVNYNPGVYICTALAGESRSQCKIVVQK